MNFKFSSLPKSKVVKNSAFELEEEEKEVDPSGPFDYVKARLELEASRTKRLEESESTDIAQISASVIPSTTGPLGSSVRQPLLPAAARQSVSQPGLVMIDPNKDPSIRGESKHIARMKETSEVNEKFKNLLKVKIADREKVLATEEFGSAPEEFITGAYRRQKQESLELEKQLEANESGAKKKDVANLFKEMLSSGSYSRTNYQQSSSEVSASVKTDVKGVHVSVDMVQKALERVIPESTAEVTKAIGERAKLDVMKIVEQISFVDNDNREEARTSAKERYLARKRSKLTQD